MKLYLIPVLEGCRALNGVRKNRKHFATMELEKLWDNPPNVFTIREITQVNMVPRTILRSRRGLPWQLRMKAVEDFASLLLLAYANRLKVVVPAEVYNVIKIINANTCMGKMSGGLEWKIRKHIEGQSVETGERCRAVDI
jgi:hypothetical protein